MTVSSALRRAEHRLREAGIEAAAADAEVILRHVLGWDRAAVIARGSDRLPEAEEGRFFALVEERAARRPLQHVTGTQAFWRHEFLVTPDVLIPRPETEILVEAALESIRGRPAPVVVDVGTGSGCVALSIAAERPDAVVYAIDTSPAALAVARENVRRLGLEGHVEMRQGDLLAPVVGLQGQVDLVASNPPYVDPGELPGLAPEVRDHEPRTALLAAEPAYGIYRRIAREARGVLRPGGHLLVEVGAGMAETVAQAFREVGLAEVGTRPDLAGISRVVSGRRA